MFRTGREEKVTRSKGPEIVTTEGKGEGQIPTFTKGR